MTVLDQLASALGRNDEQPNVELAEKLAANPDKAAIAELVAALKTGPAPIANDAIKVLYELGERRPELIADYADAFFVTLNSKNNRLVWGGMTALESIATVSASTLAKRLPEILAAAEKGSVIAKDKAVSILAKLVPPNTPRRSQPSSRWSRPPPSTSCRCTPRWLPRRSIGRIKLPLSRSSPSASQPSINPPSAPGWKNCCASSPNPSLNPRRKPP